MGSFRVGRVCLVCFILLFFGCCLCCAALWLVSVGGLLLLRVLAYLFGFGGVAAQVEWVA